MGLLKCIAVAFAWTIAAAAQSTSPPAVRSMVPAGGLRGTTTSVELTGTDLIGATLAFSGAGLTATVAVTGFRVTVTVAADAPLGPQNVTISTPSGSTTICGSRRCTFTVVESGSWTPAGIPSTDGPSLIRLLDGRILAAGGTSRNERNVTVNTAEIFDPANGTWSATGSLNRPGGGSLTLLPGGRVLLSRGNRALPAEIYDPETGTWTLSGFMTASGVGQALLLPNGKVLVRHGASFGADLFDPETGTFESVPQLSSSVSTAPASTMELLTDGRVFFVTGSNARIYDPSNGTVSAVTLTRIGFANHSAMLMPNGRILVRGNDLVAVVTPYASLYDPQTNTAVPANINIAGSHVLLPNGLVLVSTWQTLRNGTLFAVSALYDPATDQLFPQDSGTPPVRPSILLEDGRAFGVGTISTGSQFNGTFAQIYTPPAYTNRVPVFGSVRASTASRATEPISLDIRGHSFLPNSFVQVGQTKLVTIYMGAQRLVAFVPPGLRSSLGSNITVTNPAPGGGRTEPVRAGFTSTVPLPINDVETGTIRTGYIVITPDAGAAVPVSTLTYGMVRDGIVQSQAAILPTPLTSESPIAVDVVPAIGRNLGLAVANSAGTAVSATLTLRHEDGAMASSAALTLPPRGQVARFITELFPSRDIGMAFRGSVTIQSFSVPISLIGLRFSGAEFSTVPVQTNVPATAPAQSVIFPQFAMSGGWATTLSLLNTGNTSASGRIEVFDPRGNPMPVTWNGDRKTVFTYTLPPHASTLFAPRDTNGQSPF